MWGEGYNEILLNLDTSLPQVQALSALMDEEEWTHIYVSLIPFQWKMATFVPETGETYRFCLAICTEGGDVTPDTFLASSSVPTVVSALEAMEATYSQNAGKAQEASHAQETENAFCSENTGLSVLGGGYSIYKTHEDLTVSMDEKCKVAVTVTNATYLTTGQGFSIRIGKVSELTGKGILVFREEAEGFSFKNIAINFGASYGNYSYVTLPSAITDAGSGIRLDFDSYAETAKEKEISFTDETYCWLMFYGNSAWPAADLADGESITNTYRAFLENPDSVIYNQELEGRISELEEELSALQALTDGYDPSIGNVLYGKKWFATGDSFTSGGSVEDDKYFTDGPYAGKIKTYPLFIGIRNNMDVTNDAISGSVMALTKEYLADPDNVDINYKKPFSYQRYLAIPEDVDYITLWFGINDNGHTNLGTIDDTTNETFYGAWNVVMEWILTNRPWAHVGIIITNGSSASYREAEREIARKWGIPFLDMTGDEQVPVMTLGRESSLGLCTDAYNLRRSTFSVGHTPSGDSHPCWQAHEYESTFIEAFLRRL